MSDLTPFRKHRLFGIEFDVLTMRDAVDWVFHQVAAGRRNAAKYVVTPNISLTMRHQDCPEFRKVIHDADLTIVDGAPLVTASRWFRKPLPERVAGSDLVLELFQAAVEESPLRVFFLGAAPGVADRAAEVAHKKWKGVQVVGTLSPEFGFEKDDSANRAIVKIVNSTHADVLIIGLGAPKQENWAWRHREQLEVPVALCVGGTIDFLAGEQHRAPRWVRRMGIEWVWRMATNPRRLVGRYFNDALRLPRLLADEAAGRCPVHNTDGDDSAAPATKPPAHSTADGSLS